MRLLLFSAIIFISNNSAFSNVIPQTPTILYIGDSHSFGKFGSVVERELSTISDNVIMESSCGSTANTWLGKSGFEKTVCGFWKKDGSEEIRSVKHEMPKFSDELSKYAPDVVIVQLGTNMAAGAKPQNSAASILEIMKQIKTANAKCIWIGPPDANSKVVTRAKLKVVNNMLIDLTRKNNCHYIDSLKLTQFPSSSSEGIHYPPTLSAAWGQKIGSLILSYMKEII